VRGDPDIQLDVSGAVIGMPLEAGTYTFTATVVDLAENTATEQLTLTISPAP
jgi:hypothetical protein